MVYNKPELRVVGVAAELVAGIKGSGQPDADVSNNVRTTGAYEVDE
jgi:hypothetical protein